MTLQIGRRNKGFTLIEIILVIAISAVLLALAVPNFTRSSGFKLRQTVEDIRQLARWGQAMAIAQQRTYALSISKDRSSYEVLRASVDESGAEGVYEKVPVAIGKRRNVPPELELRSDVDVIAFYPDGTMDPGVIELKSDKAKISLSSKLMRGVLVAVEE